MKPYSEIIKINMSKRNLRKINHFLMICKRVRTMSAPILVRTHISILQFGFALLEDCNIYLLMHPSIQYRFGLNHIHQHLISYFLNIKPESLNIFEKQFSAFPIYYTLIHPPLASSFFINCWSETAVFIGNP